MAAHSFHNNSVFTDLRNVLRGTMHELENSVDINRLDSIHRRLDQITSQLHRLPALSIGMTDTVNDVLRSFDEMDEDIINGTQSGYRTGLCYSTGWGRPTLKISKEQIQYFLQNGFTGPDIANMFGVSLRTVRRRMQTFRLSTRDLYTNLSDTNLDCEVRGICSLFPDIGYRRLLGELQRRQVRIYRTRARECLRRVDPIGVMSRWLREPITRREYNVPGPLSLWHDE